MLQPSLGATSSSHGRYLSIVVAQHRNRDAYNERGQDYVATLASYHDEQL